MTVPEDHGQYGGTTMPERYEATSRIDPAVEPVYRDEVVADRRARFGGVKIGSAFFGWLTATGMMMVILAALLAGVGAAVGAATGITVSTATSTAGPGAVGVYGAVAIGVIVLVAYFCGGYVAGRMARFSGARQGVAVWLWAVLFAVAMAIVGAVLGNNVAAVSGMNGLPQLAVGQADLTMAGVIALVVVALVSLLGSILGGLAGMRYHRAIDRAELGA